MLTRTFAAVALLGTSLLARAQDASTLTESLIRRGNLTVLVQTDLATHRTVEKVADRVIVKWRETGEVSLVPVPAGTVDAAVRELARDPRVEYAEADLVWTVAAWPNDPQLGSLWGLQNINANFAWDASTGASTVRVGLIDTGVDIAHPDLAANIFVNPGEIPGNGVDDDVNGYVDDVNGWDFFNGDSDPRGAHWHGTHTAGTLGAVGNNGTGVTGVCWTVSIVPLRASDDAGYFSTSAIAAAIRYATAMGCKVTSNSYVGTGFSQTVYEAIVEANATGVLFVACAGNDASDNDATAKYPACYDVANVVSVAAIDSTNALASFSNFGASSVDIAAPGVGVLSTMPGGAYGYASGTSMATPHVAGTAALVWSSLPFEASGEMKERIFEAASPTWSLQGKCGTGGKLDAAAAMAGTSSPPVPPPPVGERSNGKCGLLGIELLLMMAALSRRPVVSTYFMQLFTRESSPSGD